MIGYKGTILQPASFKTRGSHFTNVESVSAMAFGALKVINPALTVDTPDVVAKSFPDFWKMVDRLIL